MICHRSEKHSDGDTKNVKFQEISEGVMFLPYNETFTAFKQDNQRLVLKEGSDDTFISFGPPFAAYHNISPKGVVFTIIQDSLT